MGSKWNTSYLTDHYTISSGLSKPAKDFGTGFPFLSFKDVFYNYFLPDSLTHLVQSTEKERLTCSVKRGDVFLTRTSETMHELGMSSVALRDYSDATFNGFCKRLRPGNACALEPEYVGYYLRSPMFRQKMLAFSTMSTRASLNNEMISRLEITYPDRYTQKRIASILLCLDKKIEISKAINQTLEHMSQTLFKSWFVDFDPVIDNAIDAGNAVPKPLENRAELRKKVRNCAGFKPLPTEIRALFPDEFEETELGYVPKGWHATNFSAIAKQIKNNVKPEDISSDTRYIGLEHLERKHIFISNYGNGSNVSSNKSAFNKNDVLFGKLRPYFHKVAISPFSGICSTDILVFREKEKIYKSLVAMYAFTDDFVEYANLRSTGTRMPRSDAKDLLNYKIVLPGNDILEHFEILLTDFWSKGHLNSYENEKLTSIRDTLLPRLISGELSLEDLPDLIKQTEAA